MVEIHLTSRQIYPVSNGGVFVLREWNSDYKSMPSFDRRPRFKAGND
ncbi:hypothetical protein SynPROSU1_01358 [Synechococcus sp. PROS-U-1]|nr:hypothetical protein SynPROSU1_01358 [Synechococcus sp. PROS-U-1]